MKFLENRGNPDVFEPAPTGEPAKPEAASASSDEPAVYTVTVSGQSYVVQVNDGGDIQALAPVAAAATQSVAPAGPAAPLGAGEPVPAPLAGNIFKVNVKAGDVVQEGDVILILEAMKMETEVRAAKAGTVSQVTVKPGDSVVVGDTLLTIA